MVLAFRHSPNSLDAFAGTAEMNPASLSSWRERLGLNKSGAAKALGLSRNALESYEKGERRIPLYIALACSALAYGLPPIN
jgi:DNA-binding XRE family transcriptional regulator